MDVNIKVLLMAGGGGTRLWPKSRRKAPKQFMALQSGDSLLQRTLRRVRALAPPEHTYILTQPQYQHMAARQAEGLKDHQILVEPENRSTTAALAYALLTLQKQGVQPDDVIVTLPSDAYVSDDAAFCDAVRKAAQTALKTRGVVVVGVKPSYPATEYGYICTTEQVVGEAALVSRFIEKPSASVAETLIQSGQYFWNSGIFVWRVDTLWKLFSTHLPTIHKQMQQLLGARGSLAVDAWYQTLPVITFEYTLVEKADSIYMVQADYDWTDLGTWDAFLERLADPSSQTSVSRNTKGCQVYTEGQLVGLFGVNDVVVVAVQDVVFVCHKKFVHQVKDFITSVEHSGHQEYL